MLMLSALFTVDCADGSADLAKSEHKKNLHKLFQRLVSVAESRLWIKVSGEGQGWHKC